MNRAFALTVGVVAALVPAMVRAQTNIDQGKSAAQIFSSTCTDCHKSVSALRKGKSTAAIAEFLSEHYTTGPAQAAALAAYVVGGRDTVASPVPGRRPSVERANASTAADEAKPERRHGQKPSRREEGADSGILPSFLNPTAREPAQREGRPAIASRNRRREPVVTPEPQQEPAVAHVPATAATEPEHSETPAPEAAPAAAAPTAPADTPAPTAAAPTEEAPTGDAGESAPRDNIPD